MRECVRLWSSLAQTVPVPVPEIQRQRHGTANRDADQRSDVSGRDQLARHRRLIPAEKNTFPSLSFRPSESDERAEESMERRSAPQISPLGPFRPSVEMTGIGLEISEPPGLEAVAEDRRRRLIAVPVTVRRLLSPPLFAFIYRCPRPLNPRMGGQDKKSPGAEAQRPGIVYEVIRLLAGIHRRGITSLCRR